MGIKSPDIARTKIAALQQTATDARMLTDAVRKSIEVNESRCLGAANLRNVAVAAADRQVAEQQLVELREEHERLVAQLAARDASWHRAAQVVAQAENWITRLRPDVTLRAVRQRKEVEYTAAALERTRKTIADLTAKIQRTAVAPLDRPSLEAAIRKRVTELAASCRVSLKGERGGETFDIVLDAHERDWHAPNALELLAWFDAEALVAKLLAALPPVEGGMSPLYKASAIERLREELLSAERSEETLIEAAHAAGVSVERRPNADVRAVLGLSVITADAATTELRVGA